MKYPTLKVLELGIFLNILDDSCFAKNAQNPVIHILVGLPLT